MLPCSSWSKAECVTACMNTTRMSIVGGRKQAEKGEEIGYAATAKLLFWRATPERVLRFLTSAQIEPLGQSMIIRSIHHSAILAG